MKLRVTKPNLYHNGKRKAVGDIITVTGDKIPTVFAGKVEPVNESGLTTDQDAGGDVAALQAENEDLKQQLQDLNEENDEISKSHQALERENENLRAQLEGQSTATDDGGDSSDNQDTSAEADAKRKAWLIDEIEELTGDRPGSNSKLETLEKKFEEAKLAEE